MSPPGDIVGAVTTGYQAWFTCEGDGSEAQCIGGWWHYSPDRLKLCGPDNCGIISWPDMRPYEKTYPTAHGVQADGAQPSLFSNMDDCTILTHFRMMADAGIDTAALQRFNPTGGEGPIRNVTTPRVARAAEATGRKWYCMYDISGWANMQSELKTDWLSIMSAFACGPSYARQNGRAVVSIWGFGFNDDGHKWDPAACIEIINWFKSQGCYVIGGVPTWWREGKSDSRDNYAQVYRTLDCISPWMVGRAGKIRDLDNMYEAANLPDAKELASLGIDYQPCVMPGDLRAGDRYHGDFYWRHWYNSVRLKETGVGLGIYISMFDEYNEGNQIAPTAETKANQPPEFPHNALDEDGVACTSDYYLRITRDAREMFQGRAEVTKVRPTEPWPGRGRFNPLPFVGLRARVNGKIVCAEGGGGHPLFANRDNVGPWEQFELEYESPTCAAIKTKSGQYVCAEPHVDGQPDFTLVANRPGAGPWETFEVEQQGGGVIALKAHNGKYVQATGDGPLVAKSDAVGWWETFEVVE
ncbi:uncharacterized protein LOC62_02G003498 [Vanrija pseudolonga]|uniref:DUF7910 domain-containing protein n=1 Tax=Vanrija pseudolonga TaxID=143232 RepID=A0AAF0Y613_9TREE|nr:hypothetical protein LOC62_02G003498 [Vanrija pseudolonga]